MPRTLKRTPVPIHRAVKPLDLLDTISEVVKRLTRRGFTTEAIREVGECSWLYYGEGWPSRLLAHLDAEIPAPLEVKAQANRGLMMLDSLLGPSFRDPGPPENIPS